MSGIGQFLYDWQTLITGFMALGAAFLTYAPVRRQLKLTQTQSNAVLRTMLLDRQKEVEQAIADINAKVVRPLGQFAAFMMFKDDGWKIEDEDAHGHWQIFTNVHHWLRSKYRWRDSVAVEVEKGNLDEALESLTECLNLITAPLTTDRDELDHEVSDEEWDAFIASAEAARDQVEDKIAVVSNAANAMIMAMSAEIEEIKRRLKQLDAVLIA